MRRFYMVRGRTFALAVLLSVANMLAAMPATALEIAYVWANVPSIPSRYAPDARYAFNNGLPINVVRRSTGTYQVDFGRVATNGANVQVSLYGSATGYCNTASWAGGSVQVRCFDALGIPADRMFLVFAVKASPADVGTLSYAWIQEAARPNSTASATYRFGDGSFEVQRSAAGTYDINLVAAYTRPLTVLATAYGSDWRCFVIGEAIARRNVRVGCRDAAGANVDSRVSVLMLRPGFPGFSVASNESMAGGPAGGFSRASDGSAQSVERIALGRYRVRLGPEASAGGHVQVTSFFSPANCWVESWGGGTALVRCERGGAPADGTFMVTGIKANSDRVVSSAASRFNLFRTRTDAPKATIAYKLAGKSRTVNLTYEIRDGLAIYQGDIVLGRHDQLRRVESRRRSCSGDVCSVQSPLISIEGENYLWPGGVIPFEIEPAFPAVERAEILAGIQLVDNTTNLLLKPRSGEDDFIRFMRSPDRCDSDVGRQGGQQTINIIQWGTPLGVCPRDSVAHEVLHAAGVWHEQSREDRNSFIRVLRDNIQPGMENNFDQHISDGVDIGPYDYRSLMHYDATAFGRMDASGNPMTTIESLTPGVTLGNFVGPTPLDIQGVNTLYGAEDCVWFDNATVTVGRAGDKYVLQNWTPDGVVTHTELGRNAAYADRALRIVQRYRLNQVCYVGRPNAQMVYFLSDGRAPEGAMESEDCVDIDPDGSVIRNIGGWQIVRDTPAGVENILPFRDAGNAYRALDIWRQFGFRKQCFVGRPEASFEYYRR